METHRLSCNRNREVPLGRKVFHHDDRSYASNKLKFNVMTDVNDCLKGEWFRVQSVRRVAELLVPATRTTVLRLRVSI